MPRSAGRNLVRVLACSGALIAADAALAQVRAGLGAARAAGARFGGMPSMRSGGRAVSPVRGVSRPSGMRAPVANRGVSGAAVGGLRGGSSFNQNGRTFINGGSGLTVKGSFADDNFRMNFRLGTPTGLFCDPGPGCFPKNDFCFPGFPITYPIYPLYGAYGYDDYAYPIDGYYTPIDPRLIGYTPRPTPPEATPPPPTNREIGDAALAMGYPDRAIQEYRAHLAQLPDDAEVIRLLGLALIDARDLKEGVAVVGLAYRKDPGLSDRAVPLDVFGGDRVRLRESVKRASVYARNLDSASAWLAMAVLVQAEGRRDVASRMVERARVAGLDRDVANRMVAALSK